MFVYHQSDIAFTRIYNFQKALKRIARVTIILPTDRKTSGLSGEISDQMNTAQAKKGGILIEREGFGAIIPLKGIIDIAAEQARLEKALAASEKEAKSLAGRLGNPAFAQKAKPEAVDKARADHAAHAAEAERLRAALARLG